MRRPAKELPPLAPGVADEGFPIGARVLVDGEDDVRVRGYWPHGSSSYFFPHYKLDFEGGERNVAVSIKRVGVDKR